MLENQIHILSIIIIKRANTFEPKSREGLNDEIHRTKKTSADFFDSPHFFKFVFQVRKSCMPHHKSISKNDKRPISLSL